MQCIQCHILLCICFFMLSAVCIVTSILAFENRDYSMLVLPKISSEMIVADPNPSFPMQHILYSKSINPSLLDTLGLLPATCTHIVFSSTLTCDSHSLSLLLFLLQLCCHCFTRPSVLSYSLFFSHSPMRYFRYSPWNCQFCLQSSYFVQSFHIHVYLTFMHWE